MVHKSILFLHTLLLKENPSIRDAFWERDTGPLQPPPLLKVYIADSWSDSKSCWWRPTVSKALRVSLSPILCLWGSRKSQRLNTSPKCKGYRAGLFQFLVFTHVHQLDLPLICLTSEPSATDMIQSMFQHVKQNPVIWCNCTLLLCRRLIG